MTSHLSVKVVTLVQNGHVVASNRRKMRGGPHYFELVIVRLRGIGAARPPRMVQDRQQIRVDHCELLLDRIQRVADDVLVELLALNLPRLCAHF